MSVRDDDWKRKQEEDETRAREILKHVHDFFNGHATLWVGELPVRFEPKKEG